MNKTVSILSLAMMLILTVVAPCFAKATAAVPASYFTMGDFSHVNQLPASFGPYVAQSTQTGVYTGTINVRPEDLQGQPLYLVIRMYENSSHQFTWVKAFVNKQLVTTEAEKKESRIVTEITPVLKAGKMQITVMASACAAQTGLSFYVVPKDMVLSALQGKPLVPTVIASN